MSTSDSGREHRSRDQRRRADARGRGKDAPARSAGGQNADAQRSDMAHDDPDACWRRPDTGAELAEQPPYAQGQPPQSHGATEPAYPGPPRPTRPPRPDWRTPTVIESPPARELPPQDLEGIEAAEEKARTFTYGVGMLSGAIMLVLLFVVCARVIG